MAKCGGCGADTSRVRRTMTANGNLLPVEQQKEICPNCVPEDFADTFNPFDRLVSGPEANPEQYKKKADGTFEMKDEALEDLRSKWDKGPSAEAIERKRKTRRTTPMSQGEIQAAEQWANAAVRPAVEKAQKQADLDQWVESVALGSRN